jgi:hypothetical protein
MLKSLIWWNLLEKREPYREPFLYEKALKTDICAVRFALTYEKALKTDICAVRFALTALFSFKK